MSAERPRVLVLGGTGMVGHTLFELLSDRGDLEVHATVRDATPLQERLAPQRFGSIHAGVDASSIETLERVLEAVRPAVVVNAIGIVKQSPAAKDPVASIEINALLPHRLVVLCGAAGARLVHISTDCVFSGMKGHYSEDDVPDAADLYGRSKLLGEPTTSGTVTLRTSVIGHELQGHQGLVEWFLESRGTVAGFRRAIFSGVPTAELARILAEFVLPRSKLSGLYHLSAAPISKLALLELIARRYDRRVKIVSRDAPAIDRSLDSSRFRAATGYRPPSWPELVKEMFDDATVRYGSRLSAAAAP